MFFHYSKTEESANLKIHIEKFSIKIKNTYKVIVYFMIQIFNED